MVTVDTLRDRLGTPPDSDEALEMFIKAAEAKLSVAGVPPLNNNALYDHVVLELAIFYYDNRGLAMSGSYQSTALDTAQRMINSYIWELRCAKDGDVSE